MPRTTKVTIPQQGAAVVGAFYTACGEVREAHPEAGAERNAAFKVARTECETALGALGLPMLTGLPYGRTAAIEASEEAFVAYLAANKPARKSKQSASEAPAAEEQAA